MAEQEIICPICGAKNKPETERCTSCGARLDRAVHTPTAEELAAERYQQRTFSWQWVMKSFGIYMGLQVVILMILPFIIPVYDPQGPPGLLISAAVWFIGGAVVGFISPGKTFFEPVVAALLAVGPTILYLTHISDVLEISSLNAIVSSVLGVMTTLFGAFIGEYFQRSKSAFARM